MLFYSIFLLLRFSNEGPEPPLNITASISFLSSVGAKSFQFVLYGLFGNSRLAFLQVFDQLKVLYNSERPSGPVIDTAWCSDS